MFQEKEFSRSANMEIWHGPASDSASDMVKRILDTVSSSERITESTLVDSFRDQAEVLQLLIATLEDMSLLDNEIDTEGNKCFVISQDGKKALEIDYFNID